MVSRRRFLSIVAACAGALRLAPARAGSAPAVAVWKGSALGAPASLELVHPDRARAHAVIAACVAEIARMEAVFSLYRGGSAISRLNAAGELRDPPLELVEAVGFALSLSALSAGAFDPTIQPLYRVLADGYARWPRTGPPPAGVARALELVDYRAIDLAPDRIRLRRRGMAITLNGIAQGFITDRIAERLRTEGFEHVLVDLGEARASGTRADGRAWHAAIADPRDDGRMLWHLELGDGTQLALATSAGAGTRFGSDADAHHLLDPHTGASANHYLSVSVTAPRALVADGLSTTLYVLPPQRRQAALRAFPTARAYVLEPGGKTAAYTSVSSARYPPS